MLDKHTEELDKLIAKVIAEYARDNGIRIGADTDYNTGIIKIKVYD